MQKCRHGSATAAGKVKDRVELCEDLLRHAEQLLDVAEKRLDGIEAYQGTWGIVFDLDAQAEKLRLQLQTAELALAEVLAETEMEGADHLEALEAELAGVVQQLDEEWERAEALDEPPSSPAVEEPLEGASDRIDEAEGVAAALSRGRPALARPLLERAARARVRAEELRARLVTVQER